MEALKSFCPPTEQKVSMDPLKNAKLNSIEVSVEAVNSVLPVIKKNAPPDGNRPMTRIVSINGVAISELKVPSLILFCKDNQIYSSRKKKKAAICERILARKAPGLLRGGGKMAAV